MLWLGRSFGLVEAIAIRGVIHNTIREPDRRRQGRSVLAGMGLAMVRRNLDPWTDYGHPRHLRLKDTKAVEEFVKAYGRKKANQQIEKAVFPLPFGRGRLNGPDLP